MNWLLLSAAALGVACVALRRCSPWLEHLLKPGPESPAHRPLLRKQTAIDRLIDALRQEKDPLARHRLLGAIVEESHRQRPDAAMNKVFLRFARMQLKELPKMTEALKAAHGGKLPPVPAFKLLANALEMDGRHEEAVSVRQQAKDMGLTVDTQAGASGRTKMLAKKIKSSRPATKRSGGSRTRAERKT
jgi:hypothetical protein